ncbi:MAG TPA: hypothetical protein VFQ66_06380, partial [Candidatus Limnocylindria bacterium]|nr:hypothetical protein [Candidatus Limnocylindria bacterium]
MGDVSSTPPTGPLLGRAVGLALALPLVCVVLISALVIGQQLRDARSAAPAATPEPSAQAGAAPVSKEPLQFIELPTAINVETISPSPDGRHLVASSDNYSRRLLLRIVPTSVAFRLTTEQVADVTEIYLDTWLPDSSGFVGHSRSPIAPQPGVQTKMKTYDVYVVATDGSKTLLGEAQGVKLQVSADGKWIGAIDGDGTLLAFARDGNGTKVLGPSGNSMTLLGWDADTRLGHIVSTPTTELRRVALDGTVTRTQFAPDLSAGGGATWSPDHRAALVTALRANGETPGLLTDRLSTLPAGALQTWVGPHELLWRTPDGRLGTLDALTGATRTLTAKMKSDKVRILGTSAPYTLWIDETADRIHITDLSADRDTTLGLSPLPQRALPLTGGRFLFTRGKDFAVGNEIGILDGAAWFQQIPPTPAPIPIARDQSGVPTGLIRAESQDGGWSVLHPTTWFRREQPMRGSDFLSYEPDLDFSGNLPPPGEVRVVVQLLPNFNGLDPRAFANTTPKAGQITHEGDVTIAGQTGYTNTVRLNISNPPPWPTDKRNWFVRSPYFSDRMLVIQASPANARTSDVDAIVASLRFARPVVAPQTPISRAQVVAKYATTSFAVLRLDRLEAKLVTWKEYELAAGGFHSGVNDPEQLIWLVLVTGEIAHPRGGGPPRFSTGASPPPPTTPPTYPWILYVVDAVSGNGFGTSCCGADARPK